MDGTGPGTGGLEAYAGGQDVTLVAFGAHRGGLTVAGWAPDEGAKRAPAALAEPVGEAWACRAPRRLLADHPVGRPGA